MAQRWHIKEILDQVGWAGLSQPEEHKEAVLQQEDARLTESLFRTAHRFWDRLTAHVHIVLKEPVEMCKLQRPVTLMTSRSI